VKRTASGARGAGDPRTDPERPSEEGLPLLRMASIEARRQEGRCPILRLREARAMSDDGRLLNPLPSHAPPASQRIPSGESGRYSSPTVRQKVLHVAKDVFNERASRGHECNPKYSGL
jgi:hypothetical protein